MMSGGHDPMFGGAPHHFGQGFGGGPHHFSQSFGAAPHHFTEQSPFGCKPPLESLCRVFGCELPIGVPVECLDVSYPLESL